MSNKDNILICIDWFTPAFKAGGPIKSVRNILDSLEKHFNFYILTSYYDVDREALTQVQANTWIKRDKYQVIYLDLVHQNKEFVLQSIQGLNISTVYFNSLFSNAFSIKPLNYLQTLNAKMVLAPRGMLGAGALKIKPLKKRAFLQVAKRQDRYKNLFWHASSPQEESEIKKHFGEKAKVEVALNLFKKIGYGEGHTKSGNEKITSSKKEKNHLNLFFYSRISKKKNLHFALRCLEKLDHLENIQFTVIGPIEEPNYWQSCEEFIKGFKNITVSHIGAIEESQLPQTIETSHVLFFPTFHENFGHVIAESLALAKPIIISDQTPWENLEESKVGFSFSLNEMDHFVQAIQKLYSMDQETFQQMQENCIPYLENFEQKYCSTDKYIQLLSNT